MVGVVDGQESGSRVCWRRYVNDLRVSLILRALLKLCTFWCASIMLQTLPDELVLEILALVSKSFLPARCLSSSLLTSISYVTVTS